MFGLNPFGLYPFGTAGTAPVEDFIPFDFGLNTYLNQTLEAPVYPVFVPENQSIPAYSYFALNDAPYYLLGGNPASLTTVNYQFDVWSTNPDQSAKMELALRRALSGYRGPMGTYQVFTSRLENRHYTAETNADLSDNWIYRFTVEYMFMYREKSYAGYYR